jgi:hypothetical protein
MNSVFCLLRAAFYDGKLRGARDKGIGDLYRRR